MPVEIVYSLEVHDPRAFIASMTKCWNSETGQKTPGYAIVSQIVSGGESYAPHTIAVVYPSYSAWDRSNAINANSEQLAIFAAGTRESVSFVGSSILEYTGAVVGKGEVETGSATTMVYQLSVSDPETYATALKRFDEVAPSENPLGLFQIRGAGESCITHVLSISANSMADLMGNSKKDQTGSSLESFIDDRSSTRSVVGTFVTADVAVFGN